MAHPGCGPGVATTAIGRKKGAPERRPSLAAEQQLDRGGARSRGGQQKAMGGTKAIVIAGTNSGVGKTSITIGVLAALRYALQRFPPKLASTPCTSSRQASKQCSRCTPLPSRFPGGAGWWCNL